MEPSHVTGMILKLAPVLVSTLTPEGSPRSSNAVPRGLLVMITSSGTLVIVRFVPIMVMIHSAVVYASVSLGVKRITMRFSPGCTLPPS